MRDIGKNLLLLKENIKNKEGEIAILIMASEVSTRRDFEIGKAYAYVGIGPPDQASQNGEISMIRNKQLRTWVSTYECT